MTEVLVALITGLFGLLAIRYKQNADLTKQQSDELKFRSKSLVLHMDLYKWSAINQEIRQLMEETSIDRFFILNAFNGYLDPRWTTAVYQIQKSDETIESYVDFGIDDHYVGLLKRARNEGATSLHTDELPDSIIKAIYHTEGVLASDWYFIADNKLDSGAVGITYCSFSSRTSGELSQEEKDRCLILVNKIKSALM